jgi:hypothetical protein
MNKTPTSENVMRLPYSLFDIHNQLLLKASVHETLCL